MTKLRIFSADLVGLSIIVVAILREVYAALKVIDVSDMCIDDVGYLMTRHPDNPEYSPIYVAYLNLLEQIVGTPEAWFTHQAIMFALFPITFYSLLRLRKQSPFLAVTISLLLLSGWTVRTSAGCQPLVSGFTIVVSLLLMISFTYLTYLRPRLNIWFLHVIGACLLSFCRPEFLISFILFVVIAVVTLPRSVTVPNLILMIITVMLCSVTIMLLGIPSGRGRFDFAFMQHFGINGMLFNKYGPLGTINPWEDYPLLTELSFGNATTFREMLEVNPHAVAAHIGMNFARLPIALVRTLVHVSHPTGLWFFGIIAGFASAVAIVQIYPALRASVQGTKTVWSAVFRSHTFTIDYIWVSSAAGYALPFFGTIVIVYPRIHYITILVVWILVALCGGIRYQWKPTHYSFLKDWKRILPIIAVLTFVFYPNPAEHYAYPDGSRPLLNLILELRTLDIYVPPSQISVVYANADDPKLALASILGAQRLLLPLEEREEREIIQQARILIVPKELTKSINLTGFSTTTIENPLYQVFIDRTLCHSELCSP